MIELYLLLTVAGPKLETFKTQDAACLAFDPATQRIYKETIDRRDVAVITEGSCQAVQQFKAKQ